MKTLQKTDLFPLGRGAATYSVSYADLNQLVPVAVVPPPSPMNGALWYHSDKGVLYTFNGTSWIGGR
jgi:hypothetical protein